MILDLVPPTDPILKQKLEKFSFTNPPTDPIQLARDITETMISKNGLGLAANQLGLPYRVFAMKSNPVYVCFNPIIVDISTEKIYLEEGCLTFPGLFIKIKRPKTIKTRFTMPNGQTDTFRFEGITARIFQHELDHLDGILYQTRATLFHREQAQRQRK